MKKAFKYIKDSLLDEPNDKRKASERVIHWANANAAVVIENEECITICTEAHKAVCPYRSFFSSNLGECLKKKIQCDGKCDYMEDFIYNVNSKKS
jgi:hypothetical protein